MRKILTVKFFIVAFIFACGNAYSQLPYEQLSKSSGAGTTQYQHLKTINSDTNELPMYKSIIDNPDSNGARWYVNLKILNAYVDFGHRTNVGIYPGIQVFYTKKNKQSGFELNYDRSVVIFEQEQDIKNHFFQMGFFYHLKSSLKTRKEGMSTGKVFYTDYNSQTGFKEKAGHVRTVVKVKERRNNGIRAGIINEKIIYHYSKVDNFDYTYRYETYSTWGGYIGFTRHKYTNNYTNVRQAASSNPNNYLALDYSRWNIMNLDLLFFPAITPDIRTLPGDKLNKSSIPFGIRGSTQYMYPIARRYQRKQRGFVPAITFKVEAGYKFIQGLYTNVTLGWQAIRY